MGRTFKLIAPGIALVAFTSLSLMGFAIWIFIPVMPAVILFILAVTTLRRRTKPVETSTKTDYGKAA
jgi:hypothetical protein